MNKIIIRRESPVQCLAEVDLPPLLKKVFANRGITTAEQIEHGLEHLLSFTTLKGIDEAVACLYEALRLRQHILILGDFDADGATSSALAVSALQALGAEKVSYLVPNRFEYGYGLTPEIVRVAASRNPQMLVTVDNGISSIEGVAQAKALGMKVVITDHHLAGHALPEADAIVNPNQPGDAFASKNLAGVGVIFYVMLALRAHLRQMGWYQQRNIPEPNMAEFLDLVALGTVADVVPLDHNNRILVQQGMKRIKAGKVRPGIQALIIAAQRQNARLTATDLAFAVVPRLNAAGRLEDMALGIECLLCPDLSQAQQMALRLDELNKERREIENQMQQQAVLALSQLQLQQDLPLGVCLYKQDWHQGVIGIVASRMKDRLHRPVIAFAKVGADELKGSARSVPRLHIRDALDAIAKQHPQLISKFGGHAMAAGLSIRLADYAAFADAFAQEVAKHLTVEDLLGRIVSDGELDLEYFRVEIADLLREASPWGQEFPEPIFDNYFTVLQQHIVGAKHLKMLLGLPDNRQRFFDAIAFNVDVERWPNHKVQNIHAAFRVDVNEFRGQRNLQLIIEHFVAV